jgi:anti-sigma-K factor RskA
MRYDEPTLVEALAREYVLGTLHGRARDRFARLLSFSLVARRAVASWERRLTPLAASVPPVAPPAETWAGIETALGLRRPPARPRASAAWPAIAAGFALAALLFGALFFAQRPAVERPTYVAVFADQTTPIWLLQAFEQARVLRASTINDRPEPAGSSYELWMLQEGANPVSLGLIAGAGNTLLQLSAAQLAVLAQTSTLAVSVEPAGGSPTGLPTGPVIFTAPLLRS